MTQLDDLLAAQAAHGALLDSIVASAQAAQTALDAVQADVQTLIDRLAAGGLVDLSAAIAQAQVIHGRLQGVNEAMAAMAADAASTPKPPPVEPTQPAQ